MTPKKDSDGNPINRRVRSTTTSPVQIDSDVAGESSLLAAVLNDPGAMSRHMALWCDHDGGYLKIRRASDSADLHLTWTWSLGTNGGKYVYVRCEFWRLLFGLELLYQKVLEVERGLRKASPDRYVG